MWDTLLDRFLTGMMVEDRLSLTYPDGTTRDYGPDTGGSAHLAIADTATLRALIVNPDLGLGEGYMNGTITPRNCTLDDALTIIVRNRFKGHIPSWVVMANRVRFHMRRFIQNNAPAAARKNVAHHYDISDDLYRLFLDEDMQYSCAYFRDDAMTLEDAQVAKKAHIAGKLRLEPGMRVLDIGCGWGGMALTLAGDHGCHVTGITLSENQLATARRRAETAGLSNQIEFRLEDYRHTTGTFDRIVSVGMLEHVGVPNFDTYFGRVAELLDQDGVALIHTIGRSAPPMAHSSWINKYIFPGGYVPSLSELAPAMERSGLWQTDIEVWRLHYAKTIRHWRERFEAHLDEIAQTYDDRFVRMFRYYLTVCILAFEHQMQAVYHLQLAHRRDAVPLIRDYLYGAESPDSTAARSRITEDA
ncbi:cyclopropane-fatty-acyl-phospholipid synthase family protein [Tateyamaria omphalii]|uniref:SAM-dependent methyltransferase n=1 Tax=Tateyamaria omphalii TaxID=299262 RepID=UPI001C993F9F|nr:cyclopropane-fatty-acyl-phospholipid synthase family protein [Tateyamaria omphalii]MBY5934159.1 cyclopropane-fatty-acyl-phospholipid synthase family protein [Tateyamaria omphalii]